MAPYRGNYKNGINNTSMNKEELLERYLKEFRVEQCPLFLQHKCQQHRPFTCFNWHFQNQRRRRPVRKRDGTFNYSADVYCPKYDETTGICIDGDDCPYLHRTAGDTERRYHLKYYKTGMCVHDTDNRGFCVKNGPHCAFAHGANDLRPPVYDIRERQAIENGEVDPVIGPNSLDKERCLLNDDPKWLDTTYVLANYKTEPCKKPPRLCRQGYACPQFHNNKDKRRSPKKFKYRSTPCPNVKSGDEWGDPVSCEAGDNCQYCHTRTEQQFHPEIYKSTKCNDIQNTSYCPRGAFCAFAHVEQETVSLDSPPPEGGHYLGDIINTVMPEDDPSQATAAAGAAGDLNNDMMAFHHRAPGSQLRNGSITPPFEENGVASPIEGGPKIVPGQLGSSSSNNLGTSIDSALVAAAANVNSFAAKNRFLSGDQANANSREALLRRQLYTIENDFTLEDKAPRRASLLEAPNNDTNSKENSTSSANLVTTFSNGTLFPSLGNDPLENHVGNVLDDLSLDQFDGNKSRKSSGFSSEGNSKSRQYSGHYDMNNKSRNCSGNSISAGLVSSGILNGSAPVMIPGSGNMSPQGNSPQMQQLMQQQHAAAAANGIMHDNPADTNMIMASQLGLFDLTSSSNGTSNSTPSSNAAVAAAAAAAVAQKDVEVNRLKEELVQTRARLASWEEGIQQARNACESWKKEVAIASKKAEMAMKEKEAAVAKAGQIQKEYDAINGGAGGAIHAVRSIQEIKTAPLGVLKTIEWQLRKDLQEVEKVIRSQQNVETTQWLSSSNNRLFDFPPASSTSDWSLGLIPTQHPLYGSMAQQ